MFFFPNTLSLESTSRFISSASSVSSRFTSSLTCQPIFVTTTALGIQYSFIISLHAQNLLFQQILPTLIDITDHWTGPDLGLSVHRSLTARTMPSQDVYLSVCPSVCHTPVFCRNDHTYPQTFSTVD